MDITVKYEESSSQIILWDKHIMASETYLIYFHKHLNGLAHDCRSSIANAQGLLLLTWFNFDLSIN